VSANLGRKEGEDQSEKFSLLLEKCVGKFKNLGPSQKSLRPTLRPKLVTGLVHMILD